MRAQFYLKTSMDIRDTHNKEYLEHREKDMERRAMQEIGQEYAKRYVECRKTFVYLEYRSNREVEFDSLVPDSKELILLRIDKTYYL